MRSIILSDSKWNLLLEKLLLDYPTSTIAIRSRMREKLGFTRRYHDVRLNDFPWNRTEVHLDFFDDKKRTLFELRYSDYL